MEKQTLPNSTLILVFGILSIVGCCCYTIPGLIFGIIALIMVKKAKQTYLENPEIYKGYQNVEAGKILSIIGIVISGISLLWGIYALIVYGGFEGIQQMQEEFIKQIQQAQ